MKKNGQSFSIVMATYTGVETIDDAFTSLLDQNDPGVSYDVVVVIDGPNAALRAKVEQAQEKFLKAGIDFKLKQFTKNKGRFEARLVGAKLASHGHILIVDDRVKLPKNFLKYMANANQEVLIPDVVESDPNNYVSLALSKLRRKIYGQQWGGNFEDFYIDEANFDKSPKGTTSLWIKKSIFIDACNLLQKTENLTAHVSEDTRILKFVVMSGAKIYKTSKVKLVYQPRSKAKEELIHIYQRGPRFLDYYLHPGTRYFAPLILYFVLVMPLLVLAVLHPILILFGLAVSILVALWVSGDLKQWLLVWYGLLSIVVCFGTGLWHGLWLIFQSRREKA